MREVEAEIWCPRCKHYVGIVWRVKTDIGWTHESEPDPMPKRCTVCEGVTERK